jgi:type VI secretion system protein ImpK
LFHTCLSLGLTGALRDAPDAAHEVERLRSRVFRTLPREPVALAPPMQAAVAPAVPVWRRRLWPGLLVVLGLITLGVYTASQLSLSSRVDAVFASMQQIGAEVPAPAAPTTPSAAPAAPARLAPLLAEDAAAGRLTVVDELHRSVVSVPAATLFVSGSTQFTSGAAALLERIGAALSSQPGKVLVVGHTDGADPRTARLPSAWHQSYEWARGASEVLAQRLGSDRVSVEGAADLDHAGNAPRRRVDIVLYP